MLLLSSIEYFCLFVVVFCCCCFFFSKNTFPEISFRYINRSIGPDLGPNCLLTTNFKSPLARSEVYKNVIRFIFTIADSQTEFKNTR